LSGNSTVRLLMNSNYDGVVKVLLQYICCWFLTLPEVTCGISHWFTVTYGSVDVYKCFFTL